jgi:sugar/nucleoside kinase (ribokinase family)
MITRFVCAGNLNVDLTFPVERLPEEHEKLRCRESALDYGGSAANTAYWLARLGQRVEMLGCVGDDPFGTLAVAALAEVGVDTKLIQRTGLSLTGMAAIFVNPGSKRMVASGGANAYFDPAAIDGRIFGPGVHLHVATPLDEIASPLIRKAKERGATVSCDLDESPTAEMIPWLDWVFVNHSDLSRWIGSSDPRKAREQLASHTFLIVTRGVRGAVVLGPTGEYAHPAFPATVVDRTGGGDAFDAGFLYGLAQGSSPEICLRLGLLLAAQVIANAGSRPRSVDAAKILLNGASAGGRFVIGAHESPPEIPPK